MADFKPLLAAQVKDEQFDKLPFPMIGTPKIDGIRCMIRDGIPVSRKLKPIPNDYIRDTIEGLCLPIEDFDGELVTYTDGKMDDFNTIQSKVMRQDGEPDFKLHVFDCFTDPDMPYRERLNYVRGQLLAFKPEHSKFFEYVPDTIIHDFIQLADVESHFIDELGWEGVMLRKPDSVYKYGRSTFNQAILLKIKRFEDDEGKIVGVTELMHNKNEAKKDALGHTERSSSKEGKVPAGTMGTIEVEWRGLTFEIGTGFDAAQRQWFWDNREQVVGEDVTFKFQGIGSLGRPRFPVFIGLRKDLR